MSSVRPDEVQESVRDVGSAHARVELLKESRHLADQALARFFRHLAHVLVSWAREEGAKRGEEEQGENKGIGGR